RFRDKKVIAMKLLRTGRNKYGFINRNDTKGNACVHQTAIRTISGSPSAMYRKASLCSLVLLKEEGVQKQQRFWWSPEPAVYTQLAQPPQAPPTWPGPPRSDRQNDQHVRVGKRTRDQRTLAKARPNSRQCFPPYSMLRPSCVGRRDGECNGQSGRESLLVEDIPERTARKKIRKVKEMRATASSHLKVSTATTSIADTDAQEIVNHEMAKTQKMAVSS
ncbi:LOW QUALITY PROTEIN: hypothetical protein J0S82_015640, partial [Galemys pyrenaicus]